MRIISGAVPGVSRLAGLQVELSRQAKQRLKWFDYYKSRGCNARLTCRHFDISPQTFYRWERRYNPHRLASLEDHSHRPRQLRQPTYSTELVEAVLKLREGYPRWGKDKLVVLLHGEGFACSTSTVDRILNRLKDELLEWEGVYNIVRPHQALGYLTPLRFLEQWKECSGREVMCH